MRYARIVSLMVTTVVVLALPAAAWGQASLLWGGASTPGHIPQEVSQGNSQPIQIDGGPAAGGTVGVNPSEIGITARGTGTAPYAGQGTGPFGTLDCLYDAPTNNATGYHYFCFSPNAQGGGLMAYGAGGVASTLPLQFIVNGATYQFPFVTGGIVGPSVSVVNDAACWNNTTGTLLKDCGAFVTVGGNNTWTGTNNFTGTFQWDSITQTFPNSGSIVGSSDTQTLTNKSISGAEINSGTLPGTVMPAFTGDVTNPAGSLATTISAGVVTNAKLAAAGAANTVKGAATSTAIADLAVPSCSGASNALQWTTGTGFGCGTLGATTAGWGISLAAGVFSISTTQPPYGYDVPINLGLTASASASALTINLVGANGSAPSATNPVSIPFRSTTLATGTPVWTAVTGALSIVVNSGATLGTSSSNVPFRLWIFAAYNAGTPELAVATCSITTQVFPCTSWETNRVTTTSITGLSTAAGTLYATSGVSNDSVRIIGYCDFASGLATAGSWASSCTTIQLMGPGVKKPGDVVQTISFITSSSTTSSGATPTASALTVSITPTSSSNLIKVQAVGNMVSSGGSGNGQAELRRGTSTAIGGYAGHGAAAAQSWPASMLALDAPGVSTATAYTVYVFTSSGNETWNTLTIPTIITADEIMGALDSPANDNGTSDLRMVG